MADEETQDTETAPDELDGPEPEDGQTFDAEYVRRLRGEAARHRTAAREQRERADAADAQLEELRAGRDARDLADAIGGRLTDPEDLLRYGGQLDGLRGQDGRVDPERVAQAVEDLLAARPYLRAGSRGYGVGEQGARQPAPPAPPSPGRLLRNALQRAAGERHGEE